MFETKPLVLFVDEDEKSRAAVAAYLSGYGYELTTAGTYADALMLAKYEDFDLLLVGGTEGGAGAELCRRVREFDRSTPLVFYCAGPTEAQGHVLKPDLTALGARLDETLRRPRRAEEVVHSEADLRAARA